MTTTDIQSFLDPRLAEALKSSKISEILTAKRRIATEEFERATTVSINGGKFTIDEPFLLVLAGYAAVGAPCVLIDSNRVPVRVTDPSSFYATARNAYFAALETFINAYDEIRKQRSVGASLK